MTTYVSMSHHYTNHLHACNHKYPTYTETKCIKKQEDPSKYAAHQFYVAVCSSRAFFRYILLAPRTIVSATICNFVHEDELCLCTMEYSNGHGVRLKLDKWYVCVCSFANAKYTTFTLPCLHICILHGALCYYLLYSHAYVQTFLIIVKRKL